MQIIKDRARRGARSSTATRRTEILPVEGEVDMEDLIEQEDMCVTLTHFGYIKRLPADTYRSQHRGGRGMTGVTTREEDFVENIFFTNTHTPILFFTNKGRGVPAQVLWIRWPVGRPRGMAIVNLLRLQPQEKITTVLPIESTEKVPVMRPRARG